MQISNRRLIRAALLWGWTIKKSHGDDVTLQNYAGKKVTVRAAHTHTGTSALAIQSLLSGTVNPLTKRQVTWDDFVAKLFKVEANDPAENEAKALLAVQDEAQEAEPAGEEHMEVETKPENLRYKGIRPHYNKNGRRLIKSYLRNNGIQKTAEIVKAMQVHNLSKSSVQNLLSRMADDGMIFRPKTGYYSAKRIVNATFNPAADPHRFHQETHEPEFDGSRQSLGLSPLVDPVAVADEAAKIVAKQLETPTETVNDLLELLFPGGVPVKKFSKVMEWRDATIELLTD